MQSVLDAHSTLTQVPEHNVTRAIHVPVQGAIREHKIALNDCLRL